MDARASAKPQGFPTSFSSGIAGWVSQERATLYPKLVFFMTAAGWLLRQALGAGLADKIEDIFCSDFLAFYTGGNFYLADNMGSLYDISAQHEFQKGISGAVIGDGTIIYMNPPFAACFFSLFSRGEFLPNLALWWIFGVALLFISILIFKNEFDSLESYSPLCVLFLCFSFFPTLLWFMYGQNTAITLMIYTSVYALLRRKLEFYAGLVFGLIVYKPQLGIGLALLFLFKRRYAALLGSITSAGMCVVVSCIISSKCVFGYLELMQKVADMIRLPHITAGSVTGSQNILRYDTWAIHSYFGFSSLLLDSTSRVCTNALYITLVVISAFLILAVSRNTKWDPEQKQWNMMIAATLSMGLLISPHLFSYDLMLLLLPIGIVWSYYPGYTNGKLLDGGILLSTGFLMYVFCFLGGQLSYAQIKLTKTLGLPIVAIQISTLTIFVWTLAIIRSAKLVNAQWPCFWVRNKREGRPPSGGDE